MHNLLIVNTFFWPQSVGGATRIAESYVRDITNRYSSEFKVYVLCADEGPVPPSQAYSIDAYGYFGATVIKIRVPARDWADIHDSRIEEMVSKIIKDFNISIAHLHSVQILTASVVVALLSANVPYVISLHDAWWLSEHQFLVDDLGSVFYPSRDFSEIKTTQTSRLTEAARIQRRTQLADYLFLSAGNYAVSESFANVYRNAGIEAVGVIENGVVLPGRRSQDKSPGNSVTIGFVGGVSDHKGYSLLLQCLWSGNFDKIVFVCADHSLPFGSIKYGKVGESKFVTVGRYPSDRMIDLYSMLDVLAAPSIWPESYGLVVREAQSFGIPVLVSDRGDIGRGIVHGRDGWIVDVSDGDGIYNILTSLNNDPSSAFFKPSMPQVCTVEQSVDILIDKLRNVF